MTLSARALVEQLPRAHGGALTRGVLREEPGAFFVDELLGFDPDGEGEHVFLHVEKRALTTLQVQQSIAELAKVPLRDVGYAGLKDKWACTRQWFSVYLPAASEPDWRLLEQGADEHAGHDASLRLLGARRHRRKLRRGAHRANRFVIGLRLPDADHAGLEASLAQRCERVGDRGFPNYFTEQRFGYQGRNIALAQTLFAGRRLSKLKRGMALSAARALLFNDVLAARVAAGSWCQVLPGDVMMLAGSQSVFAVDPDAEPDDALQQRLHAGDIHVSAPLPGKGGMAAAGQAREVEAAAIAAHAELEQGLVNAGVEGQRRSMRGLPKDLQWSLHEGWLELAFELERGCYATALVRELVEYDDVAGAARGQ